MLGPKLTFVGETGVLWEGERYVFFGGNDYHRFARNTRVIEALKSAADEYGIGSAGSRSTTANHPLYVELEESVAEFFGTEAASVFSAGYIANAVLLQAVAGEFTHLFLDEIAHASLVEAALQSGLPIVRYRHRDPEQLATVANQTLGPSDRPLVLTDGVFASSGEIPPLAAYMAALGKWPAKILVDDAHGMAVVGKTGKGCWEQCGVPREAVFQTGTLSKALGAYGGVLTGDRSLIEMVQNRSTAFTGSTPVPMPLAAAALESLKILREEQARIALLQARSERVKEALRGLGFRTSPGPGPICSVTFLDSERNRILGDTVKAAGIYPTFINYPGCPPGGHFRFTMTSVHTEEQVDLLLATIAACAESLPR